MNRSQLTGQIKAKQSYLCVGLDTDVTKIPAHLQSQPQAVLQFNKAIIDATKNYCVAYKINTAFYEVYGLKGWEILEETLAYIPSTHFTIADAKRGDIGNTSAQYARTFFETYSFDAVTVAPYMGEDSIRPFLEYTDKFTIVLGLTSNKGAGDFEYLKTNTGNYFYEEVISKISTWGTQDNLMFVVGATQAKELENIRKIIPSNFLLIPGVGAQGGSLEDVSKYGMNKDCGLLVNVGRSILYASTQEDFAETAATVSKEYQQQMTGCLKTYLPV
ncbi:orotidine-5'-phosphate decarboxylase [Parafilimonas terrae]|uniref:Orotidine-5'-phosphate decarboxylase n=1 Tax=Parafilimonas terrae TaxID=1465490 RepID=A0A1I5UZ38_9BACT|nr:orotidine-5'-phosphate decarboxylase [Parafilimonas terrae]SFQ00501.1 orotidine-5'-phosphate decarboxylase [Parafilimonas terrae]